MSDGCEYFIERADSEGREYLIVFPDGDTSDERYSNAEKAQKAADAMNSGEEFPVKEWNCPTKEHRIEMNKVEHWIAKWRNSGGSQMWTKRMSAYAAHCRAEDAARIKELERLLDNSETCSVGKEELLNDAEQRIKELEAEQSLPAGPSPEEELVRALEKLTNACALADSVEELSDHVDGSLLDAAFSALARARKETGRG